MQYTSKTCTAETVLRWYDIDNPPTMAGDLTGAYNMFFNYHSTSYGEMWGTFEDIITQFEIPVVGLPTEQALANEEEFLALQGNNACSFSKIYNYTSYIYSPDNCILITDVSQHLQPERPSASIIFSYSYICFYIEISPGKKRKALLLNPLLLLIVFMLLQGSFGSGASSSATKKLV